MKVVVVVLVVVVLCAALFLIGVLSPSGSRWLQKRTDKVAKKAQRKSQQKAGHFGDLTGDVLKKSRHAVDRSAEQGREVRDET